MGLNYSLCCIFERANSRDILRHLAPRLDSAGRNRLGALDWAPTSEVRRRLYIGVDGVDARGVAGLAWEDSERDNHFCFSLAIALEPELEAELNAGITVDAYKSRREEGLLFFGCMWLSVRAGEEYVLLQLTGATSDMSRVLEQSESIAEMWRDYARASKALLAYIDRESDEPKALLPERWRLELPDEETLSFENSTDFSVDHFVSYILSVG